MENIKNFDKAKEIIKNNLISKIESINDATSEDEYFEYLKNKDISDIEFEIVKNKEKENDEEYTNRFKEFIKTFLVTTAITFGIIFIFADIKNNILLSFLISMIIIFFYLIMSFLSVSVVSESKIKYMKKNASPDELKDLYKKEFKTNIDDYLSLSKEEIRELCDSNEFIRAYVENNPNEIFTRYSLNKVAGIKMNNLHMINEFKDVIDNKKILDGLPDGQKIVVNDIIMDEQKLN